MIVLSALFYNRESILTYSAITFVDIKLIRTIIFAVLMGFSCLAVIFGCCGLCCLKETCAKNRCFPICYGILLLSVWIIILVIGIVLTTVSF